MNDMVLFILVYFAAAASAKLPGLDLASSKIEMKPNNTIQYLQFDDVSYNLTDFTICAWVNLSNFSDTQTIFRLTGNNKKTIMLWKIYANSKETMRVTIQNQLVASESTPLTKRQWNHVCFQWKGWSGVWAIFVNTKVHSVGHVPSIGNDTMSWTSKLHGKGTGIVGDDTAPCRNGWQTYGLYMTGSVTEAGKTDGKSSAATAANAANKAPSKSGGKSKNNNKRQAVYESDADEPSSGGGGGSGSAKPFQWLTKTFAFVKRMFTFVIIPFFKFVRNTFFQTRSLDDTVVDVSETHLTVSEIKYTPPSTTTATTTTTPTTAAPTTASEAITATVTATAAATTTTVEDLLDELGSGHGDGDGDTNAADNGNGDGEQRSSSSKREAVVGHDDGCDGAGRTADHDRVTMSDLLAVGETPIADDALSPNARRYLRTVTNGLNDVGVNVAFVKRSYACCRQRSPESWANVLIDWDRTRAKLHNVTSSPHVCGRS